MPAIDTDEYRVACYGTRTGRTFYNVPHVSRTLREAQDWQEHCRESNQDAPDADVTDYYVVDVSQTWQIRMITGPLAWSFAYFTTADGPERALELANDWRAAVCIAWPIDRITCDF